MGGAVEFAHMPMVGFQVLDMLSREGHDSRVFLHDKK
jgi:hypothetical protein